MDGRPIREEKVAFSNGDNGYVWMEPKTFLGLPPREIFIITSNTDILSFLVLDRG